MVYRERFVVNPTASSSSPYPGGFNLWIPNVTEHISLHVTSERQNPDTALDPRCQSGPSARKSFDPDEGDFQRLMEQTNKDCRYRFSFLTKFPTPTTFACWKIRFKTDFVLVHNLLRKLCFGSKKCRWLNQWMISNLRVLSEELTAQNFEILDARIASALNKIIQNTRLKKKVSLEEMKAHKEDHFFRGRQFGSLGPTILSRSMRTYLQLFFDMMIFRNSFKKTGRNSIVDDANHI